MSLGRRRFFGRLLILVALPVIAFSLPPLGLRFALNLLSPFIALNATLASHRIGLPLLCALPMTALVLWRKRFFCRFFCPLGLLTETCGKLRPQGRPSYRRVPHLGLWALLLSLGGAFFAAPFFLFLDPIAIFSAALSAASHGAYALLLLAVLLLSIALPGLWCRRLCPLGAFQDLASRLKRHYALGENLALPKDEKTVARRTFIALGGGAAGAFLLPRLPIPTSTPPLRPPGAVDEGLLRSLCLRCGSCVRVCPTAILRPDLNPPDPSALLLPRVDFSQSHCLDSCLRCGESCPSGAISPLPLAQKKERKIGLAVIDLESCLLTQERDCSACTLICPRQAIQEIFSRQSYSLSLNVAADQCNGCGACVQICPPHAIEVAPL